MKLVGYYAGGLKVSTSRSLTLVPCILRESGTQNPSESRTGNKYFAEAHSMISVSHPISILFRCPGASYS